MTEAKIVAVWMMVLLAMVLVSGCSLEVQDAGGVDANDDCFRIALDGSGYCVEEDDPTAKRTVEMCGADSDDVFMLCREDDQ